MIDIKDKKDCCGCSACAQICPKQCIKMLSDDEGFAYPSVDKDACIGCGLCERVCPIINSGDAKRPLKVYASKNSDEEVRADSSSGGVFSAIAGDVIRRGGVVFGVSFDDVWNSVHTYTEDLAGLASFRGSKYLQSRIGQSYAQVKSFLQSGREVLFSGTPCQIAGLHGFLRKQYPNLLTVEILCHGVPSSKVWQRYLDCKKKEYSCDAIRRINFRDKKSGWAGYNVTIEFANGMVYERSHKKVPYFRGFIRNLYLRPSCYECKCKNGRSGSDIIIADYWNINNVLPEYNDDKGVSLVLINTEKGASLFGSLSESLDCVETGYEECIGTNKGFAEHLPVADARAAFFRKLNGSASGSSFPVKSGLMERLTTKIAVWKNRNK